METTSFLNQTAAFRLQSSDNHRPNYFYISLVIVPLLTIFGNSLVVIAVCTERGLKTSTNYLLVSLAIADLLIAVTGMPFYIYQLVNNNDWSLHRWLCNFFLVFDVSCSTASIVHLMAISIDRCYAVARHLEYRNKSHTQLIYVCIGICWVFSFGLGLPVGIGLNHEGLNPNHCGIENELFMLYGSIFGFYIPCITMIIMYGFVFYRLRIRMRLVELKEMAKTAERASCSSQNLEDMVMAAYGSVDTMRRKTLTWALPFLLKDLEDGGANNDDTDSISSQDIEELNTLLYQIENSTTTSSKQGAYSLRREEGGGAETFVYVANGSSKAAMATRSALRRLRRMSSLETVSMAMRLARRRLANLGQRLLRKRRKSLGIASHKLSQLRQKAARMFIKLKSKQGKAIRKEAKATKLVTTVMIVFLLCWLPFFTTNMFKAISQISPGLIRWPANGDLFFTAFTWLGCLNSCLNPLIYTMINRHFRVTFAKLLRLDRLTRSTWFEEAAIHKERKSIQLHELSIKGEQLLLTKPDELLVGEMPTNFSQVANSKRRGSNLLLRPQDAAILTKALVTSTTTSAPNSPTPINVAGSNKFIDESSTTQLATKDVQL